MNYQLIMEDIISKLDKTPTLLLHSCCGPCSSYVLSILAEHFQITVFYYNPNIYPKEEYEKRKEEQIRFIKEGTFKNAISFIEGDYESEVFDAISKGLEECREGMERCFACYLFRMEKTCKLAKAKGYDYFATTLSVSPHKNANKLNEIGKLLEEKYKVKYLYSDFKKKNGYLESIRIARKYNLYRQDYCGCKYSRRHIIQK